MGEMNLENNGALPALGGPPSTTNTTDPASIAGPDTAARGISERHPKGWGHVPKALMRDSETTVSELAVYAVVTAEVSYQTGHGPVRLRRIWENAHVDRKTVYRAIHSLEVRGYLKMSRKRGQPYFFQVLSTDPDKQFDLTLNTLVSGIGIGSDTSTDGGGGVYAPSSEGVFAPTPQSSPEKALVVEGDSSDELAGKPARPRRQRPKANPKALTEEELERRRASALRRLEAMAGYKAEVASRGR